MKIYAIQTSAKVNNNQSFGLAMTKDAATLFDNFQKYLKPQGTDCQGSFRQALIEARIADIQAIMLQVKLFFNNGYVMDIRTNPKDCSKTILLKDMSANAHRTLAESETFKEPLAGEESVNAIARFLEKIYPLSDLV